MDMDFCLDVVAGMLELDPARMRRKFIGVNSGNHDNNSRNNNSSKNKNITIQGVAVEKAIINLKKMWEKYDWTAKS